jgi:deoxyribonuclease IV
VTGRGPLVGAHMSVAGGLEKAIGRGVAAGCRTIQLFTRNSNRWAGKPVSEQEAAVFRAAAARAGFSPLVSHSAYLINLGSSDPLIRARSVAALRDELVRCHELGIPFLVLHPGTHGGDGEAIGIDRIARGIDAALEAAGIDGVDVLLETAAGQGACVGHSFGQLKAIRNRSSAPGRIAVCFDTCHVHAAGYDVVSTEGWRQTLDELDDQVGLSLVKVIHANDSKRERGCRVDRHERIGHGAMGEKAFAHVMRERAFRDVPKILETPKDDAGAWDREGLAALRRLAGRTARSSGS